MNTITLLNGIKSMFSSLGAKTSDSNYAVGLYDKTSAEPKGIMAMSSLASVLGVGYNHNIGISNNGFTSYMQGKVEDAFQAANAYTSFDIDFKGQDQEGRFLGEKHSATIGEGLWISKGGICVLMRNSTADNGTWIATWIYKF